MFYHPQIPHFCCMEIIIKRTFDVTERVPLISLLLQFDHLYSLRSLHPPPQPPRKQGGILEPPLDPSNPMLATKSIYESAVRTKDTMCYTSIAADTPASNPSLVSCCSEPIHTVAILCIAVRLTPYPARNEGD